MLNYLQGPAQLNFEWSPQDSPLASIYSQLKEFSGVDYRIIPGQAVEWGQAHSDGINLLSISTLRKDKPILAYMLVHEWGHEALGHQSNLYPPPAKYGSSASPPSGKRTKRISMLQDSWPNMTIHLNRSFPTLGLYRIISDSEMPSHGLKSCPPHTHNTW